MTRSTNMPKAGAAIRLLVIGFGNPLRSDDALGWHVAQELSRTVSVPAFKSSPRIS
ncbi:MAG TPA: hypothetical protein VFE61_33145 [Candidatus Sulfotelmatobacter sp.]|nr:hypothetical protein [Candidatus Sulfotelmatobacter sp.]